MSSREVSTEVRDHSGILRVVCFLFHFSEQTFVFNITTYKFCLHIRASCSYKKHHRNPYFPAYILSSCINPTPISKYSHSTHLCHIKSSPESSNALIRNEPLLNLSTVHSQRSPTCVSVYISIQIHRYIQFYIYIQIYIYISIYIAYFCIFGLLNIIHYM